MARRMALLAALAVAGCAPGADLPMLPDPPAEAYRLGPDDTVHIITFDEPQLTGYFRISQSGTLSFPLIGIVDATGQTPIQLAARIADQLRAQKFFRNPSVSAEVTIYRPIYIIGEVAKPGEYPYAPGMTVLSAVAVAGGFTYRAITDYASVIRREDDHVVEGRLSRRSTVAPGDVITIFERHF